MEMSVNGAGMPLPLSECSISGAPPGPLKWQPMLESRQLSPSRYVTSASGAGSIRISSNTGSS
jgi:hypothetical protein